MRLPMSRPNTLRTVRRTRRGEPNGVDRHRIVDPVVKERSSSLDRALLEQARRGDADAFETIVRSRIDAVYRLTLAIVGDEADAQDATQETFVAAWRRIASVRDLDQFDAWLQRIAVNSARMVLRGRRRRHLREITGRVGDDRLGTAVGNRPSIDPASDGARLAAALGTLSIERRTILALHHLEGLGLDEIATTLGIPVGTAKSRLFTARRALEKALADESDR